MKLRVAKCHTDIFLSIAKNHVKRKMRENC